MKKGFTLIELVFVIVILGVLATVAIPKLVVTRDDAEIARAKAQIAAIRSAIQTSRNAQILAGKASYPDSLEKKDTTSSNKDCFFSAILTTPLCGNDGWTKSNDTYTVEAGDEKVNFTYNSTTGAFTCEGDKTNNTNKQSGKCTKNLN